MDAINQRPRFKGGIQATIGLLNGLWIRRFTGGVWRLDGDEHLAALDAPRGMIIAANHRSFFDLYVCAAHLVTRHPHLIRRLYCPVRTNFFYTRPLGALINLALSGGSMWPPVFRDERGRALNPLGIEQLAAELTHGGVVGLHPEGKRSTDDPYTLLSAKPGLGRLMKACHPDTLVMPYFTLGMSNDLGELLIRNRRPVGQRGAVVSLRFGAPLRAGDVVAGRTALAATAHVMEHIHALGQADKAMRATIGPA